MTRDAVFISYRRADAAGWAGRIHDRLAARLGDDRVFVDVTSLRPGIDFAVAIDDALARSAVVVVVIGPEWTSLTDDAGRRRLDDPDDFVVMEVDRALAAEVTVIPVYVDGATAPASDMLPPRLVGLARRQGLTMRPDTFGHDTERLLEVIEESMPIRPEVPVVSTTPAGTVPTPIPSAARPRWVLAAIAAAVLAIVIGIAVIVGSRDTGEIAIDDTAATAAPAPTTAADEDPDLLPLAERAPRPGDSFQYVLSEVDLSVDADVYDIDWQETTANDVASLEARGVHVICYVSAGTYEEFRPDINEYPEAVLGNTLADFSDERWLDIRARDDLRPIIAARLDVCVDKGFSSVEFDNVDGFTNDTGFDLTEQDQLAWLADLVDLARERDLSPGLKNTLGLVPQLVDDFDWLLVEQCMDFDECDLVRPFAAQDKAIFLVQYDTPIDEACADPINDVATMIVKTLDLDATIQTCAP